MLHIPHTGEHSQLNLDNGRNVAHIGLKTSVSVELTEKLVFANVASIELAHDWQFVGTFSTAVYGLYVSYVASARGASEKKFENQTFLPLSLNYPPSFSSRILCC